MKVLIVGIVVTFFSLSAVRTTPPTLASSFTGKQKGVRERLKDLLHNKDFRSLHITLNTPHHRNGLDNFMQNLPTDSTLYDDLIKTSQAIIDKAEEETTTLNNKSALTRFAIGSVCIALGLGKCAYDLYAFSQNPDLNNLYNNLSMYASELGLVAYGARQVKQGYDNGDAYTNLAYATSNNVHLAKMLGAQKPLIEVDQEDDNKLSLSTSPSVPNLLALTQQE